MSQFLAQNLSQQMRMEQRLTPQLIQSMAILQKPVAELEAFLDEALKTNAALEVADSATAVTPEDAGSFEAGSFESVDDHHPTREVEHPFARVARFARAYDLDGADRAPHIRGKTTDSDEHDPKMGALANAPGRDAGLHEHLKTQWQLADIDAEVRRAGDLIINQLDPDGYLRDSLERIGEIVRPAMPPDVMQRALLEVQRLDPAGVGAREAKECLLLQLERLPGDNSVERTLIQHHLEDIAEHRLSAVAKTTGFSLGEIHEAIKAMRSSLFLHPGHLVGRSPEPTIRPDVIVDYAPTGDELMVRLTRGNLPDLRIREEVLSLSRSKETPKETREFARKHVEAAGAIIDAVNFRRQRLLEVSRGIVEKQREFFDVGPQGLKVLRMGDLARELDCDPSTVSRTVADKYMQSPRGILPLRYFFTGGTEKDGGESVGWDQVRTRVHKLIEGEDNRHPFSDDQVVALLKKEGIELSRRTVAKYRQQLSIPAARRRRRESIE